MTQSAGLLSPSVADVWGWDGGVSGELVRIVADTVKFIWFFKLPIFSTVASNSGLGLLTKWKQRGSNSSHGDYKSGVLPLDYFPLDPPLFVRYVDHSFL